MLRADDETEILGLLSHGLKCVSVYGVASVRRLGGCASGLAKPFFECLALKADAGAGSAAERCHKGYSRKS